MLYCHDFQLLAPSGLGWIQDLAPTVAWTEKGWSHVGWNGGQPGAKVVHIHIDRVGTFLETDEYYRCRCSPWTLDKNFWQSCRFVSSLIQGQNLLLLPKESFSEGASYNCHNRQNKLEESSQHLDRSQFETGTSSGALDSFLSAATPICHYFFSVGLESLTQCRES